jgi:hypothetical protein
MTSEIRELDMDELACVSGGDVRRINATVAQMQLESPPGAEGAFAGALAGALGGGLGGAAPKGKPHKVG